MATTTKMLTLRLPVEQAQDLETLARVDGMSVSEEIRDAITARVESRRNDREFQDRLKRLMDQEQAEFRNGSRRPAGVLGLRSVQILA